MTNFHAAGLLWESRPGAETLVEQILRADGEVIRESPAKQVTRHRLGARAFYVKRYRHDVSWWRPWKYLFKAPRSHGEWRVAQRLEQLNIPCVPHLAHGERRGFMRLRESALITEGLPDFAGVTREELAEGEMQRRVGKFARRLHDCGVHHEDFIAGNLLYSKTSQTFCLVDLDKITLLPSLSEARRLYFLGRLCWWLPLGPEFYAGYGQDFQHHAAAIAQDAERIRERVLARRARRAAQAQQNP